MHRDLKPANIFVDSKDNLKLGDLGLGRDFTSQTMEAFSRVGTPLYMSPEVLQGNGYDFKSDVWSLGCISYELCALISPFKDETKKMSLYDLFTKKFNLFQNLIFFNFSQRLFFIIFRIFNLFLFFYNFFSRLSLTLHISDLLPFQNSLFTLRQLWTISPFSLKC